MIEVPVYNMQGEVVGTRQLNPKVFGIEPNLAVMHQALVRQLANARLGTHKTKTRGEVRGGGRKPWRQKGTGRARQGSIRAPHWRKGGIVFGPRPRSYRQEMPKKMRRLAVRSALSVKVAEDGLRILDRLELETFRTKEMKALLERLDLAGKKTLIVLPEKDLVVQKSASNLPGVRTILALYLNVRDLLSYDYVLMPEAAVERIEAWLG